MKGEISVLEFVISLSVFIGVVAYVFFLLLKYYPIYLSEVENERKWLEAYQISEILVNDPGEPKNWESLSLNEIKRFGLSEISENRTNLISLSKVSKLREYCNDYETVKKKLDSNFYFSLFLVNLNDKSVLLECLPPKVVVTPSNISVRRILAFSTGGYGELTVQVW